MRGIQFVWSYSDLDDIHYSYSDVAATSALFGDSNGEKGDGGDDDEYDDDSDGMVTIDILTMALLILSVLYSCVLILATRKYLVFRRLRPELSPKKLLILSVILVCAVRIMTILGVASMNIANVRAHYSLQPPNNNNDNDHHHHQDHHASINDRHQSFYDKSMTVLFDLPNCMVVSTYVLLALVWAECFVESRLHTESGTNLKRTWLIYVLVFNSALYSLQLTLYGSIFLAPPTRTVRSIVYCLITCINFTAVLLVLIFYICLNLRFSGFPYRSQRMRVSMARVSSIMTLWSLSRFVWAIGSLLVFVYKIELLQDSNTPFWSFVILLLLFFGCEILPIVALLDDYLPMVGVTSSSSDSIGGGGGIGDVTIDSNSSSLVLQGSTTTGGTSGPFATPVDGLLLSSSITSNSPQRSVRWRDEITDPLLESEEAQQMLRQPQPNPSTTEADA